jgi:phosphoserine phosphatase
MPFGFSPELDAQLVAAADDIRKNLPRPHIAAFDADGTLWQTDVGELFFQYQIDCCDLPNMPADPWHYYETLKKTDHRAAYLWLAQINKGQSFNDVRKWAQASVNAAAPLPVFAPQARLIQYLTSHQFEIYIVTASVQWAVAPAAHLVGVKSEHVLGIQTAIEDGVVTDRQHGELTWREGKATGLIKTTGVAPHLSVGNTIGDEALLRAATHTRLAICSGSSVGELAQSEEGLQQVARAEKWLTHQF